MVVDWSRTTVRVDPRVGRVRCELGWHMRKDFVNRLTDLDLWLVWAGKGMMRTRTRTVTLRPGICIWMRPNAYYEATQDPDDRLGVTYIHFDLIDRRGKVIHDDARLPPEVHDLTDLAFAVASTRRVVELMTTEGGSSAGSHARRAAETILTGLLIEMDMHSGDGSERMRTTQREQHRLMTRIASSITESPADVPSIADLATQAGYSSDHFSHLFRSVMGMTPQAFIVQARLDRAKQLLLETSQTVSEISQTLGYRDVFFFSRQFKQKTGVSPSEFRDGA